jgi:hypothetical protein
VSELLFDGHVRWNGKVFPIARTCESIMQFRVEQPFYMTGTRETVDRHVI